MKPLSECRLYTFVDTGYLHGRRPADVAQQLCDGGSDIIQLRAKNSTTAEIARMAEEIAPVCERAGVWMVINDNPEVALRTDAPFVHLGQEDFFDSGYTKVAELKSALAQKEGIRSDAVSGMKIGLSTHAPAQAERAVAAGADYVAIGPIYATGTKPTAKPVTLDYVRWAATHVKIPWFAIGGVNLQTLDDALEAGARRICIVSAILNAPDIAKACSEFKKRILSAPISEAR